MQLALVANAESGPSDESDGAAAALEAAGATVSAVPLADFCDGAGAVGAGRLATVAARLAGIDRVIVAGGDGSIGPAAALAARAGVPLGVVPTGTANDFARWLGLPLDVEAAAGLAADPAARLQIVELADAGGRPFVNAASAGLSVDAARAARSFKRALGPLAYPIGALRAGLTGRPLHAVVHCDGEEVFRGRAWQVVVAATGAFGGGAETGGADPEDLRLDVAVVSAGPRLQLVRRALAMRDGRLVEEDGVPHHRGRVVEVGIDVDDVRFNVDGEVLPGVSRFAVVDWLRVVAPR